MARKVFRWIAIFFIVVFVGLQAYPYGHDHTNPPVREEPKWDSPATRALAVRACFDCHSNQTAWPWYSYVAPLSWAIRSHVDDGRNELNFSEWDLPQEGAEEAAEEIEEGEMPLWNYLLLHSEARLTAEEKEALIHGLQATFEGEEGEKENGEQEKTKKDDRN